MLIPYSFQITRKKKRNKTLNGHEVNDVVEKILQNLDEGFVTESNYWAAELLSSKCYNRLWEVLFGFYLKWIHIQQPQLFLYMVNSRKHLDILVKKYGLPHENVQEVRNWIAQIVSILSLSSKNMIDVGNVNPSISPQMASHHATDEMVRSGISISAQADVDRLFRITNQTVVNLRPIQHMLYRWMDCYLNQRNIVDCLGYYRWFLDNADLCRINPIKKFKVPNTSVQDPIWLVWYFFYSEIEMKKNYREQLFDYIDTLLEVDLLCKKNVEYRVLILYNLTLTVKFKDRIPWGRHPEFGNTEVIRQVALINWIYRNLNEKDDTVENKESTSKFYQNTHNQIFVAEIENAVPLKSVD